MRCRAPDQRPAREPSTPVTGDQAGEKRRPRMGAGIHSGRRHFRTVAGGTPYDWVKTFGGSGLHWNSARMAGVGRANCWGCICISGGLPERLESCFSPPLPRTSNHPNPNTYAGMTVGGIGVMREAEWVRKGQAPVMH